MLTDQAHTSQAVGIPFLSLLTFLWPSPSSYNIYMYSVAAGKISRGINCKMKKKSVGAVGSLLYLYSLWVISERPLY